MPYPLRNLLTQLEVKGLIDTGELITDEFGNQKPAPKEIFMKITVKSSGREKYYRALSSSGDSRLPVECYILDSWEITNGVRKSITMDLSRLNPLLTFSTGTLSIYSKEQIDLTPVQKIFGVRFIALLDGSIPTA